MMKFFHSPVVIYLIFLSSITTAPAQLEPFGMDGLTITALTAMPQNISPSQYFICAGTDSQGVYVRNFFSPDSPWVNLGLSGKSIYSVTVQHWGVGPVYFNTVYAGREVDLSGNDTLIYQFIYGVDSLWRRADSGLTVINPFFVVSSLGSFHYGGHDPPQPLFSTYKGSIFRSWGFDIIWQPVLTGHAITLIQPHEMKYSQILWGAGNTIIMTPVLARSTDLGDNWDLFYPVTGDNECFSLEITHQYPDTVFAGLRRSVIKTTDGGLNWAATSLQNVDTDFMGIEVNPQNPAHIVAGGTNWSGEFSLYESKDGGLNWNHIQPLNPTPGITCMISEIVDDEFIVYLGTSGAGVYRYQTAISGLNYQEESIPRSVTLNQSYPNPFNSTTTISFRLSAAGFITLNVYDVIGNQITTLLNQRKPAGIYRVNWEASNIPSGIYFYRLKIANESVETRKMILMR